jgi:hypothetical protein
MGMSIGWRFQLKICLWLRRSANVRLNAEVPMVTEEYISGWKGMESITIPKLFSE